MTEPEETAPDETAESRKPGFLAAAKPIAADAAAPARRIGGRRRALLPLRLFLAAVAAAALLALFLAWRQGREENQITIADEAPLTAPDATAPDAAAPDTAAPAAGPAPGPAPGAPAGISGADVSFAGQSADRRSYSVTAARATERTGDRNRIDLEKLAATVELASGERVRIAAGSGTLDRAAERVDLGGGVTLEHGNGMRFATDAASVDLKTNTASGASAVTGSDARASIAAEGFAIEDDGKTVRFLGRSAMTIQPKKKEGQ